jgi:capsular polysaccharide biosynthesis protein
MIVGVFFASIAGSLGIAYVRELGKQVMSTAAEAENKLDLPVLITIPSRS